MRFAPASRRHFLIASALLAASPLPGLLRADDLYWSGSLSNNWYTTSNGATNWNTDATSGISAGINPSSSTSVYFAATNPTASNLDLTFGNTGPTVAGITVLSGTSPVSLTGSTGISLKLGSLFVQTASSFVMTNPISATGSLTLGGTLTLGDPFNIPAATFAGPLTFLPGSGGTLRIDGGNLTVGAISGDATSSIQQLHTAFLKTKSSVASTYSGSITGGFSLDGGGTLTLDGSSNTSVGVAVHSGRLILNNSASSYTSFGGFQIPIVADTTNSRGILEITDVNVTLPAGLATIVGSGTSSQGAMIINGGQVSVSQELWLSSLPTAYGALVQNGGTLTIGSWLALSRGNSTPSAGPGVFVMNGGTLRAQQATFGSIGHGSEALDLHASATFIGGASTFENAILVGEYSSGVMTVDANAQVNIIGTASVYGTFQDLTGVAMGAGRIIPGITGILNLNGGTLTTPRVISANGTYNTATQTLNFNGGLLKASLPPTPVPSFIGGPGLRAFVYPGGAIIDDSGLAISVDTPLEAPTGNGLASISGLSGTGYFAPPLVTITGGGGTGATASANIDASGHLTAINITNPGINYTAAPTITLSGGGGTLTGSATSTLAPSTTGSLIKRGTGTLTLAAPATFNGPVSVQSGLLSLKPNAGASKISALTLAGTTNNWTSTLDLTNNPLILQSSSPTDKLAKLPTLQNQLTSARDANGPNTWTAPGITSSTIASDPTHLTLALADNADLHYTSFKGQPLDDNALILTQATFGDANLDQKVDAFDLNLLAAHWQQQQNALWSAGDFNTDGKVDAFDLNSLAANWQFDGTSLAAALATFPQFSGTAVPEPASLTLLLPSLLLARRPRARNRST